MIPRLQQWIREDAMPTGQGVILLTPENCMAMQAEACTYWTHAPTFTMYFPDLEYLWSEAHHSEGERQSTGLNFYHEVGHVLDFSLHRHGYRLKWFEIMHYQAPESARQARELAGTRNPSLWFSALDAEGERGDPRRAVRAGLRLLRRGHGLPGNGVHDEEHLLGLLLRPQPAPVPGSLPPDQRPLSRGSPRPPVPPGEPLSSAGAG